MAKQQEENKAVPVRAIYFTQAVKWPGVGGAGMCVCTSVPPGFSVAMSTVVESIFLYKGEFVIDGRFFMDRRASSILTFEYA